jgi:ABC-type branched-subunit amino acid transport system ATPase component
VRDLLRGAETLAAERRRCADVLDLCGLLDVAHVPATTLPLGQRRAVELARALVSEPQLLLTDEPSSGLDPDETSGVIEVLRAVRREAGLALVVIDHDLATVEQVAERVIAMDAGQIVATGTFAEVVRNPVVIESWLGRSA